MTYKPHTRFAVAKTDFSELLQAAYIHSGSLNGLRTPHTLFGILKTDIPDIYKSHINFEIAKTDSLNIYDSHTYFVVIRLPNFYRFHIRLGVVKMDF